MWNLSKFATENREPSLSLISARLILTKVLIGSDKTSWNCVKIYATCGLLTSLEFWNVLRCFTLGYFSRVTEVEDGETIIKMSNDSWVVGKKSDQREVYIIIHEKNANLIEINGKHSPAWNLMLEFFYTFHELFVLWSK